MPPESWPKGEGSLRNWLRLKNSKKAAENIRISNDAFFTSASSGAPPESWPEGEGSLRNWLRLKNSKKAAKIFGYRTMVSSPQLARARRLRAGLREREALEIGLDL